MKPIPLFLIIAGVILLGFGIGISQGIKPLSVLYGQSSATYVGQPTSVLCYEGFGPQSSTGATITYDLTWGDGSPDTFATTLATQYTFTHVYSHTGNYLAVCTVTANGVSAGIGSTAISVNPAPVTSTVTTNGQTSTVTSQVTSTNTGITLVSATTTQTITASQTGSTTTTLTFPQTTITQTVPSNSGNPQGIELIVTGIALLAAGLVLSGRKAV